MTDMAGQFYQTHGTSLAGVREIEIFGQAEPDDAPGFRMVAEAHKGDTLYLSSNYPGWPKVLPDPARAVIVFRRVTHRALYARLRLDDGSMVRMRMVRQRRAG